MRKTLIADSDPDAAATLGEKMTHEGWAIRTCSTVEEALDAAPAYHPDLFILEVMLKDGLGCQIARAVRRHSGLYHTAILFASAASDTRDIEHYLHEGGDEFLAKPFTAENLRVKLDHLDRLQKAIEKKCPSTGFHSVQALHRDIEHLVFREEDFALCYLFPRGLTRLKETKGNGGITPVAHHTAQIIRATLIHDGFYDHMCCHLGNSHFMVRMGANDYERFFKCVTDRYSEASRSIGANNSAYPDRLRLGVVYNNANRRYRLANKLFADLRGLGLTEESRRIPAPRAERGHNRWVN